MEIGFFISELLIQHNEVSLSGFGTFCKNNRARYNPEDRKFYPPANRLSFKMDEGDNTLLFKYISKLKNISEASAEYFTDKFVKELRQQLESTNRAEILPLGEIERSDFGYVLKQVSEIERTQYFGLIPVSELQPKQDFRFSKAEIAQVDNDAPVLFMNANQTETGEETSESSYSWIKVLVTLAVCIIIGVSGYIWYKQYYNTDHLNTMYSETPVPDKKPELSHNAVPAADSAVADSAAMSKQSIQLNKVSAPDSASAIATHENTTFEVIVAAFATEKEAEEYIEILKKKGIDAKIVGNSKKSLKISLGSYTDKVSGEKAKAEIRKNFSASAWLYEWKSKK